MEGSITFNQLGIIIAFAFIAVVGGYALMTLRNFSALIKEAAAALKKHKNDFDQIVPNVKVISENTLKISEEVKKSVYEAGEAVRTISHETTDTVLTINETADCLAKYALVIGEIVKAIVNMFSSNEKVMK